MKALTILLFSFFIIQSNELAAQKENQDLCLETLNHLKQKLDSLIEVNPDTFDFFGEAQLDEEKLKLYYPHFDDKKFPGVEYGMYFQFTPEISSMDKPTSYNHSWQFLDIGFNWYWRWSGPRGFNFDSQEMVMKVVRQALRPISDLENRLIPPALEEMKEGGRVLHGAPKLALHIEYLEDGTIEIQATSKTIDAFSISRNFNFQYVLDDSVYNHHIPFGFMVNANLNRDNPFKNVIPLKKTLLKTTHLPIIGTNGRRLRILARFHETSWTDYGPTIVDGSPIHHNIKDAWTGTVISNEIYIPQVDKDE